MQVTVSYGQIKALENLFGKDMPKKIRQQLHIAINRTAKVGKRVMAKQIKPDIATSQKVIMSSIEQWKKADPGSLSAQLRVNPKKRASLKEFGARQTKAGVTYKTSPAKGRQLRPGAFMGPKPGVIAAKLRGHAFQRVGSTRKPLERLHGPSPYGVFLKRKLKGPSVKQINKELRKQVAKRIQFIKAKLEGKITR